MYHLLHHVSPSVARITYCTADRTLHRVIAYCSTYHLLHHVSPTVTRITYCTMYHTMHHVSPTVTPYSCRMTLRTNYGLFNEGALFTAKCEIKFCNLFRKTSGALGLMREWRRILRCCQSKVQCHLVAAAGRSRCCAVLCCVLPLAVWTHKHWDAQKKYTISYSL